MKLIVTIAVGSKSWAEQALNCCLSVKANNPDQHVGLICTAQAIEGIESLIDQHFDWMIQVEDTDNPRRQAFRLKTELFELLRISEYDEFIYMDADVIMMPGKTVDGWFDELTGQQFAAYCNDIMKFDEFGNGKLNRRDTHSFWCNTTEVWSRCNHPDFIPQIDGCFLYWKKNVTAQMVFECARLMYADAQRIDCKFKPQLYKGEILAEMCFNIACAVCRNRPSVNPTYRPVFLEAFSGAQNIEFIQHQYRAFGFAGVNEPSNELKQYYAKLANYYRAFFGVILKYKTDALSMLIPDKQIFAPTRKNNFIASIYLTGSKSNWNNFSQKPNIKLLERWAISLKKTKLTGIIFHNCFSAVEIKSFRKYPVKFSYVTMPNGHNSGLFRFEVYADFIERYGKYINNIFFTDSTDVEVLRNPFADKKFRNDKIYIGHEPWNFKHWTQQLNAYSLTKKLPDFNMLLNDRELAAQNVLNAGLIGGNLMVVEPFIKQISIDCAKCFDEAHFQDMPIVNLLAYTKFRDKIAFGHHVNTEMGKWDVSNKFSWFSHK